MTSAADTPQTDPHQLLENLVEMPETRAENEAQQTLGEAIYLGTPSAANATNISGVSSSTLNTSLPDHQSSEDLAREEFSKDWEKYIEEDLFNNAKESVKSVCQKVDNYTPKVKTRFRTDDGIHSYFEKLVVEVTKLALPPVVEDLLKLILSATVDTVGAHGLWSKDEMTPLSTDDYTRLQVVKLERSIEWFIRGILTATGWLDIAMKYPIISERKKIPSEKDHEFLKKIEAKSTNMTRLPTSVKIAYLKYTDDVKIGSVCQEMLLKAHMWDANLLDHLNKGITEFTLDAAAASLSEYFAVARKINYLGPETFVQWTREYYSYISNDYTLLNNFRLTAMEEVNRRVLTQEVNNSVNFLSHWLKIVGKNKPLTTPRKNKNYFLEITENGGPKRKQNFGNKFKAKRFDKR